MIASLSRKFAEENLLPFANQWDANSEFPVETIKKSAELGFGGIYVKEEVGGSGLGR